VTSSQADRATGFTRPTGRPEFLEVHLEELGRRSWVTALVTTVAGSYGSAQCRFVARPAGTETALGDRCVVGATFPVMRAQDLDDQCRPNAWLELAQQRLGELDGELRGRGWRRAGTHGRHWWSLTYCR
jgi:hypothetical protein